MTGLERIVARSALWLLTGCIPSPGVPVWPVEVAWYDGACVTQWRAGLTLTVCWRSP